MRNILLLTATITPPEGVPVLTRTDPAQRLKDYAEALRFYLRLVEPTFSSIVFAENSASDISSLRQMVADAGALGRVEFLSFWGLDHPVSYGRGYGEFKLVDYAMQHAAFLRDDVVVWKCTGRYKIKNITDLVKRRPLADLYCNFRNYPERLCDLYLMSFNKHGHAAAIEGVYKHLRNDVVVGHHANEEASFRRLINRLPQNVTIVRRFNVTPVIDGTRGWNNTQYSGNWHPKTIVRKGMQLLAPWVWI